MILILHIVAALTSLIFTSMTYFAPTQRKLGVAYGLLGLTFGSGTYLIVVSGAEILRTCIVGLLYSAAVIYGIVASHRKLAVDAIAVHPR